MANTHKPCPEHPLLNKTQCCSLPQHRTFHPTATVLASLTAPPLDYTDVYTDDFMIMAQPPLHLPAMNRLLHTIDSVFQDDIVTNRGQIVSQSKLQKGDATFSSTKRILGWDLDTSTMTLHLPPARVQQLQTLLEATLCKKRTSKCKYQQLLSTLRSSTPLLYGANNLFSSLQYALWECTQNRVKIMPLVWQMLRDWILLATEANKCPVPLHTVVPRAPHLLGATDASKFGMGGCWMATSIDGHTSNYLWRTPFPSTIQENLVSTHNPAGSITNSNLELAAIIQGSTFMELLGHTPHAHLLLASDNTPAVSWVAKGSTTSTGPAAYLLHLLAQQRWQTPYTLTPVYTPGNTNTIADCCSRFFSLTDSQFVQKMNAAFPVQPSWKLVHPSHDLTSSVILALSRKLRPLASPPLNETQETQSGTFGTPSV
jgi:hypothetical protein